MFNLFVILFFILTEPLRRLLPKPKYENCWACGVPDERGTCDACQRAEDMA